jgi:hypothetical protein
MIDSDNYRIIIFISLQLWQIFEKAPLRVAGVGEEVRCSTSIKKFNGISDAQT